MTIQSHPAASAPRMEGAAASPYTPPFSVQGSCVLSEDYFLTDQLIINPGDLVRPFIQSDGTVEALVVTGGNLGYLKRDPAATSGWTYVLLSGDPNTSIPNEITDVAVGTDGSGNVMGVFVTPSGDTEQPVMIGPLNFDTTTGTWSTVGDADFWVQTVELSPLRAGLDPAGGIPYFYARDTSGNFSLYLPSGDGTGFDVEPLSGPGVTGITDAWVMWTSSAWNGAEWAAGIVLADSGGTITWYQQDGQYSVSTSGGQLEGQGALLWVGWPPAGLSWSSPGYAYQDAHGDIWFATPVSETLGPADIGSAGSALGPDKVAVWQDAGLFSFAMLVGDTVNVVTEYGDPAAVPLDVAGPIPLQPDVTAVYSAPADATAGTLFVVLADATLNVLARDPATGWSLVPVQQDSATLQELDSWRVQLSVTDANGAAVAGAAVTVGADRPAGTWQASGSTLLGPGNPATFTTSSYGRVTFATPAVELDAPQLTVQVVSDDDAGDDSAPAMVSPDADVHAYLAGAAPLNDMESLSGSSLVAARKADGTPLCPGLAGLSGDDQANAASAVVSAINQCVKAGQGATPGPDDAKSWTLDLSGAVPAYTSSPAPGGVQAPLLADPDRLQSLSGWWDTVKNDAESFFHAVRHDAIQVATCTANWVQDEATGAWNWAISLAVTVEDEIIGTADYVITDMRSAIHTVTGFFQKLGAEIGDVITWLRQNIGELIQQAGQNAQMVQTWLTQLPLTVNGKLTEFGQIAEGFFANLEDAIDQKIDAIVMPGVAQVTFGSAVPSPPSGAFDMVKYLGGVQHNWLLDKIESFFASDTPAEVNADLQQALTQLATALQDGLQFVTDIGALLWNGSGTVSGLNDLFASGDSYNGGQLAQLVALLKQAVHDLLAFADALVQALIDLGQAAMSQLSAMLSHGFEEIPLVGQVLKRFGVETTMNVGHLVSLVLMYPATLASRIISGSGSTLFPAGTGQDSELGVAAQPNWAFGLGLSAAIGQGIWGAADAVGDLSRVVGKEPSGIIGWIDIASPLVLAILEWPGAPNEDGSTAPPFANAIDGSGPDGAMIWPNWLLGLVPPVVGLCGQFADYQPPGLEARGDAPEEWPEIGQYFTMASAIASTVLGSIYNFQTDQSAETEAAGILGNVSNIIAPFATKELAETTEGGSEIIKFFIDYLGNLGAAGCMGAALEA